MSRSARRSTPTPPLAWPERGARARCRWRRISRPRSPATAWPTSAAGILRWLREVPGEVRRAAGDAPLRLGIKLMNARFDEAFQLEMLAACAAADALVCFNRLWDPALGVAYGGWDLSERNLRVLRAAQERGLRLPPLVGTGNVCSGRVALDYARAGCESVELHTFFQLPLARVFGQRRLADPACSTRALLPSRGRARGRDAGPGRGRVLHRRDGELRFLDLCQATSAQE